MAAKREKGRKRKENRTHSVEARKFYQVKSSFKRAETPHRVFEIVRTAAGIHRRAAEINLSSISQTSPKTFGSGLAHHENSSPSAIRDEDPRVRRGCTRAAYKISISIIQCVSDSAGFMPQRHGSLADAPCVSFARNSPWNEPSSSPGSGIRMRVVVGWPLHQPAEMTRSTCGQTRSDGACSHETVRDGDAY